MDDKVEDTDLINRAKIADYDLVEMKIYENSTINVNDCPKYLLNFHMTSGTLECNVVATKNSIICDRE